MHHDATNHAPARGALRAGPHRTVRHSSRAARGQLFGPGARAADRAAGVNGSGKTTLLKAAAGLLPHTGQCLLDGVPLESLSTRRLAQTVSYIPQQSGISVSLSAREVVLMGFNPRLGVLQSPTAAMRAAADGPCAP